MITTEKLKIFDKYRGDIDGLARVGRDFEKKIFDNDDWYLIANLYQDIDLMNKRLATQTYLDQTFLKLKENCDIESFEIFTGKIKYYKDFQMIAELLKNIKSHITSNTDTVWAGFDNADTFLLELNYDIKRIELCDFTTLEKVHVEFLPTCTYQELSISNGWSEDYMKLSSDFDILFERLTEKKTAHNMQYSQKGFQWFAKLISRIKFIVS